MADELRDIVEIGLSRLQWSDPELYRVLSAEHRRQAGTLSLVASSSVVDPMVLVSQATSAVNVTAEGYPGARYHAGCAVVDDIESLAIARAKRLFGAQYVNVQPHSATTANYTVLSSLLSPGDTLLGMRLEHGGHLTHGSPASYSGRYFTSVSYGLDEDGAIDYDGVAELAALHRPKVIICGATAYPRTIDFARFRAIADEVGAYLMADVSHTAGLIVAGLHPSPIDHAHITTTCTHKQLFGPRGGLIMSGRDHDSPAPRGKGTLASFMQRAVFPYSQGAPVLGTIAAKAAAFARADTPEFRAVAQRIVETAGVIARRLGELGYEVVTGGTDNHIVLVDLRPQRITGLVAERALEDCHIVVNKNRVSSDRSPATVTGGIRIGTNSIAARGLTSGEAVTCANLLDQVLSSLRMLDDRHYVLDPQMPGDVIRQVTDLCAAFPLPFYPEQAHSLP